MTKLNWKLLLLGVLTFVVSACSSSSGIEITEHQYGSKWPFSVSVGRLECKGKAVVFYTEGKTYGLNGMATKEGYLNISPIWKEDPKFFDMAREIAKSENRPVNEILKSMGTPTKVSIGDILNAGLKLCN